MPFRWPDGRRCALSLTYDDALPVHYENVGPRLEAHGLHGTFYLKIAGDPMRNPAPWRQLAAQGHELGNHTLFHPCRGDLRRSHPWLDKAFDLRNYTPLRLQLELQVANGYLHLLDGKKERTYANTCFATSIGRGWNKKRTGDLIRNDFVAARGGRTDRPVAVSPSFDLMNIDCCLADGRSFQELCDEVCAAREQSEWLIYVIHGIGSDTHSSFIEEEIHERLLTWLAGQRDIWIRPFIEVASWIRQWQQMS